MPDLINNKIEYNVVRHPEWFMQSLRKAKTLQNNYIRVIPNVTKDVYVKSVAIADNTISQVDNRDCAWTPSQRITLDGKTMSVKNFKINEQQCLEQLDSVYSEMVYNSYGASKTEFPKIQGEGQDLESSLMFLIQNSLSNDIEKLIWGGTGNVVAGVQDGIIDKALADENTIKVANAVTIDASNVLDEIKKVYDAIPNSVLSMGEFEPEKAQVRIFVDLNTFRYLKQALSTTPTNYQVVLPSFAIEGDKVYYMGIEIVVVGLPDSTMVAASRDNLVFVTDLLSDTANVKAEMGNNLTDESVWYVKGAYRANADYIFSDEVVVYSK